MSNLRILLASSIIVTIAFSGLMFATQAQATAVTLSVTVDTSLTFSVDSSSVSFGTITPGASSYTQGTTTLTVSTNDTSGWLVTLSGDYKNSQPQNNLQMTGATSTQITDQAEWIPGSATTTSGTAVVRASLDNSGNVLAFRVMSASSTNGTPFLATSWWGATDADGTAKWAGIASSTVSRTIGNAGTGSYSSSAHINTVQYYLKVASTQASGAYTAPLTYTATAN